jgi:probable rRNA maturation factor
LSIKIFYDEVNFRLKGWRKVVKILNKVIRENQKISGDLNFIITNDEKVRKINVQFLGHNYNTDVITFNYNSENVINGEVYISIETVRKNALNYNVSLRKEVERVIIHGILHLLGHDDKTKKQRIKMKEAEDLWVERIEGKDDGF